MNAMDDVDRIRAYYVAMLPYYDATVEDRGDLPFWESIARRWGSKRILELGCGTGRVTRVLGGRARVTAVDLLVEMLRRVPQRAPDAMPVVADLRCFAFAVPFDLVVLADDPLAHIPLTDERTKVMRRIAEHLAPKGRLVIEGLYRPRRHPLLVPKREIHREGGEVFTVEELWTPAPDGSTWRATYRFTQGSSIVEVESVQRSWSRDEVDHLPDHGLEVESVWGDFDESPLEEDSPRIVIVATRGAPAGSRRTGRQDGGAPKGSRLERLPLRTRFGGCMRWLRGISIAFAFALAVLIAFALLLPSDGTKHILELRGRFGGADVLAARRDARSSIRCVALRNDRGEVLTTAWIRRPLALRPDYRIVVTYAGARTGDAILRLIPAKDDLVVVAVQYPWRPPHTAIGRLRAIYDIRQAAYRTVAGGILAVDDLATVERLDPRRIVLVGASLGSIFATIHGAIDRRVPQVVLVHGGADLQDILEVEIPAVPSWLRPPLVRVARISVDTFDPAHYVRRIAPRRLLVIAARDDWRFPPRAVMAFFKRAGQPKELRWTNTAHVGVGSPRVVDAVIAELNAYL